jgi:hypothetical protein
MVTFHMSRTGTCFLLHPTPCWRYIGWADRALGITPSLRLVLVVRSLLYQKQRLFLGLMESFPLGGHRPLPFPRTTRPVVLAAA